MAAYVLLAQARKHLREIGEYTVAHWGKDQAKIYLKNMKMVFELLSQNPSIGTDRGDELQSGFASFVYKSHVIYYKREESKIVIYGILHHAMSPQNHLRKTIP